MRNNNLLVLLQATFDVPLNNIEALDDPSGDQRRYLVSASADQTTKIWDLATGRCMKTFGDPNSTVHVYLNGWNTAVGGRFLFVNVFAPTTGFDVAHLNGLKDMVLFSSIFSKNQIPVTSLILYST